jgi:hypothetical protein
MAITNEVLAEKLDNLADVVKKIDETINGNGNPGMKVRLDRLEQIEDGRRWNLRTIWGALVAILVGWAFKWTTN